MAAARSRNAKKVPSKAPKTASELERTWRELRNDSELWREYLGIFKKKALEKLDISLCRRSSSILLEARRRWFKAAGVLAGASKAPGWAVTKALLSQEDPLARVAAVADAADVEAAEKRAGGARALDFKLQSSEILRIPHLHGFTLCTPTSRSPSASGAT